MKYITKRGEPLDFTVWKNEANEDWKPTYDKLSGAVKQSVKTALMKEQGYICCYCECRLAQDDSHIEHFRPQSYPSVDPLDFGNMLCSCQSNVKKGEPRHCGNLKEDWFDARLLISPLASDCESRFVFTGDGSMKPSKEDDCAAFETIRKLGLNIPKLRALRAKVIEPFLDESLSMEDFRRFVSDYLNKDEQERFSEFWTTIYCLFSGSFIT
jgi:uncharacterized protein (TIGR02646 family)